MEEKKKMNLDEIKKAKMPLNDDEISMVSGAGDGLWMVSGDPECPDCPGTKMNRYCEEGNLITYICPICHNTITLFDQG
jgi:hypothetical protein